ncbi:MAG: hypothetical protein ACYSUD_14215, partial [Planctomycetota bacterium]
FFTRIQPFTPEELSALEHYICTIPRPPNRYRPLGAELTDAQRRGKMMFERSMTDDGRDIPKEKRCVTCHFPPLFTDRQRHNVGTKLQFDRESDFDTPHLSNIYDSAPYLHNGIAQKDAVVYLFSMRRCHDEILCLRIGNPVDVMACTDIIL